MFSSFFYFHIGNIYASYPKQGHKTQPKLILGIVINKAELRKVNKSSEVTECQLAFGF